MAATLALFIGSAIGLAKTDPEAIIIVHQPSDPPDGPRSLSPSIEAYYETDSLCVYATLSNAGTSVSVEFVNNTTDETAVYVISGTGSSVLPISGTPGYWTVTFTLENGQVYFGAFSI